MKWLTDPASLKKRFREEWKGVKATDKAGQEAALRRAQHKAILEIDKHMAIKDATGWTEKWYVELFGKVADEKGATVKKVETQVKFEKEALNNAGIKTEETRVGDVVIVSETAAPKKGGAAVEKNTLKDVKSHEGELTKDDRAQYADYKEMIGKDVPHADRDNPGKQTTTKIHALREVFLDPRGGKANAEFIAKELRTAAAKRGEISFEVFNTKGERRTFTGKDAMDLKTPKALEAAIIKYCDS
jgi:hypothetical protein